MEEISHSPSISYHQTCTSRTSSHLTNNLIKFTTPCTLKWPTNTFFPPLSTNPSQTLTSQKVALLNKFYSNDTALQKLFLLLCLYCAAKAVLECTMHHAIEGLNKGPELLNTQHVLRSVYECTNSKYWILCVHRTHQ